MRKTFLVMTCMAIGQLTQAQLKATPVCNSFTVDVVEGSVNNLYPESPLGDIMNRLPCYTQFIEEPSATGCAGVFYKDKGISFYTYRDYIEINETFKGTMTLPLMGADHSNLFKWFGLPKVRDVAWEAYQMHHGILVVFFNGTGRINRIIMSSKSAESIRLCD
jgi:hypothetical protein